MNEEKIILDLCGGTGSWSKPYSEAGYDVRLITLPDNDVCSYSPPKNVYGILAAPPCQAFSPLQNYSGPASRNMIAQGLEVVESCMKIIWKCQPRFWALENPGRGSLRRWMGGRPTSCLSPRNMGIHGQRKPLYGDTSTDL